MILVVGTGIGIPLLARAAADHIDIPHHLRTERGRTADGQDADRRGEGQRSHHEQRAVAGRTMRHVRENISREARCVEAC